MQMYYRNLIDFNRFVSSIIVNFCWKDESCLKENKKDQIRDHT
jgi:hypothetical protein